MRPRIGVDRRYRSAVTDWGGAADPRRSRRGITIIEVIVLMTGVAAMLGLSVILLQLLMKLDADSRSHFDAANSLARLARQLRRDVHAAGSADLVDAAASKGPGLRIERGGGQAVEYQVKGNDRVIRTETMNGKDIRREAYPLPKSSGIRLSLREEEGRKFVALAVDRLTSRDRKGPTRGFEILALVGKNVDRTSGAARSGEARP